MGKNTILSIFQSEAKKLNLKQQEYLQSYHYQRGIELCNQGSDSEAFDEFNHELREHPQNGMAHYQIAHIYYQHGNMGSALEAANNALNYLQGTENREFLSQVYYGRGKIHRALLENEKWKNDIHKSLNYKQDSVDALGELGDYYYYREDYDNSDVQYNKIIDLQPHNPYGYMGRGRNDQGRKEHRAAIAHFDKAAQMASDYASAHSFKAESLLALNKISDAIDSIITAVSIDQEDRKARDLMLRIPKTDIQGLYLKIKAKALQNQDNASWYNLLGWVCAGHRDMKEAVWAYQNEYRIRPTSELLAFKALCWFKMGAVDKAIEDITFAIEKDPRNYEYKEKLSIYRAEMGLFDEAISDATEIIAQQPDNYRSYYNRGRFYFEKSQYSEAIKDFDTALSLKDNLAVSLLFKGWALSEMDNEEEATKVWQSIIEKKGTLEDIEFAIPLALYFLDYNKEAVDMCQKIIAKKEKENDIEEDLYLYAAAVYCRTNNTDKAIECLKKSVDNCNYRIWFMKNGKLLRPLQENEAFQSFIGDLEVQAAKDRKEVLDSLEKISTNQLNKIKAEIPFVREGRMCKVRCEINGLPLYFIFDTGASDVTMSSVEATFMLKNGYLSESDLSGKQYYRTADGSIAEGVNVRLHNVVFAGLTLSNVKAAIVTNQSAPLLLGQTVLERLGRIEIDNDNMLVRING